MSVIHKFPLHAGRNELDLPEFAVVRHFAAQNSVLCIWVEIDQRRKPVPRKFLIEPTGAHIPDHIEGLVPDFVASTVLVEDNEVWHLYELISSGAALLKALKGMSL